MAEARLIGPDEALERHADEWRSLAERRGNAFVSPEWFECWRRHYGGSAEVAVAVVELEDGRLGGLVPLALDRRGFPRVARIAGSNLADWMHPVAESADEAEVAGAAIAALSGWQKRWGAIVLDNVDAEADWAGAEYRGRRDRTLRRRERSSSVLPYASLEGDYEDYLSRRSGSFRRQLRRFDRRLEREAEIALRPVSDPDGLEDGLQTFFDLHLARWQQRGGSSLGSERAQAFHRDFARAALERGWLRLLILEADATPIAAFYGWRLGDRYAFYQAGFDSGWSHLSVGNVLHGRVIASAIAEGAASYDMLLGSEAYKFRFCESVRRSVTVVLTSRLSPAGVAVAVDAGARSLVRRLPAGPRERVRRALGRFESRLPTGRRR